MQSAGASTWANPASAVATPVVGVLVSGVLASGAGVAVVLAAVDSAVVTAVSAAG